MKDVLDKATAEKIAYVLNKRGFVTYEDFPICPDGEFGPLLKSEVRTLRNNGYTGGDLLSWNTNDRQIYWTYGAMDRDWQLSPAWLDAYTNATACVENSLQLSGLTIGDMSKLLLGFMFCCSKNHQTKIDSNLYRFADRAKPCDQAYGVCGVCNEQISSPSGIYRLF
ncbi:hypothetical protein [Laribacter hongkongensis]|uniref:hypothetical protein n=1 Tax=Laribacter hongkongensis TaxID=168471 RepID=UPI0011CCA1B7|nr:hypothetical protein [Laribacter hongkongensis]MCG9040809.1 hypothetical protein [Laribacter hongkongensis]MCG9068019.1 hypothetical protein [Laribacter hongkongensis]MCG9090149.1 hypothetical protein [Laribacter hongkongensis]MCG9111067.1 hypothetical protein [Laribacter hongkongensis]MCG9122974.1 hypothetical protein [Laribacter hongkongensis]